MSQSTMGNYDTTATLETFGFLPKFGGSCHSSVRLTWVTYFPSWTLVTVSILITTFA